MCDIMIEVEKKFILKEGDREKLLEGAEFLKKQTVDDTYYDTEDYSLAKKDWWPRERNGNFELKIGVAALSKNMNLVTQHRELETDKEIREAFNISSEKPIKVALKEAGYRPTFSLITTRERYKKEGFTIDLDSVDYGYELAEIELMVEDENQVEEAGDRIRAFAEKQGLSFESYNIRGKVMEYIKRYDPVHYQAIIDAWERG